MSHRRPHALLLAAALACGACGRSSPASAHPARVPDGTVHLLLINGLQGLAEGVPCNAQDVPPLAGAAQARDRLVAQGQSAALLLVGDTLTAVHATARNKAVEAERQARAEVVLAAVGAARPAAFVPGPPDLMDDAMEPVLKRCAELGVPVLLSNVEAPSHPEIKSWLVLQGGTLRIGLLGVMPTRTIDPDAVRAGETGDDQIRPVDLPGATVLAPHDVVQRLAKQLRAEQDVDFVILLSSLSGKTNNGLLDTGVDAILGSSEVKSGTDSVLFTPNNVMLATALPGGEQVGHTVLHIVGGTLSGIRNLALVHTLPPQIEREDAALKDLVEHYGTSDVKELAHLAAPGDEATFEDRIQLLQDNKDVVAELGQWTGSSIDHFSEPLQPVAAGDAVSTALSRLGGSLQQALATPDLGPVAPPDAAAAIPDAAACENCHAAQVSFWRGTPHARAFDVLAAGQRQHDAACLKCHAAGFNDALGWDDPRLDAPLGPVSCWSCHRTLRKHAEKPRESVDPAVEGVTTAAGMNCEICHVDRRSPGFDRARLLPSVTCPPMRDDEPPILLARQAALDQIASRRREGKAGPRDEYIEARTLIGLSREEGWVALDRVAAGSTTADSKNNPLVFEIAYFVDRHGRGAHALDLLRALLARQPADPDTNYVYADLLLHGTDAATRSPALAAQQLGLVLPPDATKSKQDNLDLRCLQVEALIDADRIEDARSLLFVLLRDHPHENRLIALQKRVNGR